MNDRPGWPQFLLPAPAGPDTTIDDQLAAMQQTTPRQVRASLLRAFGDQMTIAAAELAGDPVTGLREIAGELRHAYDRLIAPYWPRIRAVLDADIAYRVGQLAAGGAAGLFAGLHPDWTAGMRPVSGSTIRLLGRPRAELLELLRSPATTTDVARTLNVTPSAVSQHLGVLRASGLVAGQRRGRGVLYATTERGMALMQPGPGT